MRTHSRDRGNCIDQWPCAFWPGVGDYLEMRPCPALDLTKYSSKYLPKVSAYGLPGNPGYRSILQLNGLMAATSPFTSTCTTLLLCRGCTPTSNVLDSYRKLGMRNRVSTNVRPQL